MQLDTPVWLKTVTQVNGRGMTAYQEPHIQKIEGPGERPDTLRVLISSTVGMSSQIQKAHGGQSVTVWLKKPSERLRPGF
ncbi:MAG TPA: hypothetical protein VM165_11195 [Planctomycetaceae bacterium]|nr:hypothetical protein [Planctomycetaceae bacterium]